MSAQCCLSCRDPDCRRLAANTAEMESHETAAREARLSLVRERKAWAEKKRIAREALELMHESISPQFGRLRLRIDAALAALGDE